MDSPLLISAGQKLTRSAKSGLTFPAVLVQFPALNDASSSSSNSSYRRWRVKLDFLQLNRVLLKYSRSKEENCTTPVFPKKAYARLCENASTKPWMVPTERDCLEASNRTTSHDEHRFELKGVVHRLNLFLIHVFRLFVDLSQKEYKNAEEMAVIQAWTTFAKNEDSPNLLDLEASTHTNETRLDDGNRKAAALGQYFASVANAERVVNTTLEYLFDTSCDTLTDLSDCVLIEPSCGDGRIIHLLLNTLEKRGMNENKMPYIIGYDIDEDIINQARQSLHHNNVYFKYCNFLQQSKEDVAIDIMHMKRMREQQVNHHDELTPFNQMRLVFFGGPPYSSGLGSGALIDRDLPLQFITHSIITLGAEFVSFLLPLRCIKNIEQIVWQLNHSVSLEESVKVDLPVPWKCQVINLDHESLFDFRGSQVYQPSVLQCWMRMR